MSGYLVVPIVVDAAEAEDTMQEVVRRQFPAWTAADSDPMTVLLRAAAVLYGDAATMALRMGEEAFRFYGRSIADVPPVDATSATGTVTITAQDTAGPYVIPDGLEITGRGPLGEPFGFTVVGQWIIPNGSASLDVPVEAAEEGTDYNEIGGPADFSEYVDYLVSVAFVGITTGGLDAEPDETFLDRLQEELATYGRPTLPHDFEVRARRFGAYRATAIDGLDPIANTTSNKATITVAAMDPNGAALDPTLAASIAAMLVALRESGWRTFVIGPTSHAVDVAYTATAYPDWNPADVQAAADGVLAQFLSAPRWGLRTDTGEGDREWLNEPKIAYADVIAQLYRVEGLRRVDSLGIAFAGGTPGTADLTMTGYAPVPDPGAITGTVS